jgi:hypothetical protein
MLRDIRIASPCSADWDKMVGDERVRFCRECNLNVYNFSAMPAGEVEQLLQHRTGRVCARFYRRADGTMLTKDCPVGWDARVRRISRVAGAALSAAMGLGLAEAQNQPPALPNQRPAGSSLVQIDSAATGIVIEVADETGAVITRANVRLLATGNQGEMKVATDSLGRVHLPELPAGWYSIEASARGFKTAKANVDYPRQRSVEFRLQIPTQPMLPLMGAIISAGENGMVPLASDPFPLRNSLLPAPPATPQAPPAPAANHRNALARLLSKVFH